MSAVTEQRQPWWKPRFVGKLGGIHKLLRIRISTALFAAAMLFLVMLANLPGQDALFLDDTYFMARLRQHYEHGWPLTYLTRDLPAQPISFSCWRLTRQVQTISAWRLGVDLLVGLSCAFAATAAFRFWQARRRTWWRLSLVEALLLMTAIAMGCVWIGYEKRAYDAEQNALREVQSLISQDVSDWTQYQRRGPTFLREIVGDDLLVFLDRVAVFQGVDRFPDHAGKFPYLMYAQPWSIGREELAELAKLRRLQALDLSRAYGMKESLLHPGHTCLIDFTPLPSLQYFQYERDIGEGDLDWLLQCSSLRSVKLSGLSNEDIQGLNGLTHVEKVSLSCNGAFLDETLESIAGWKNLRVLELDGKVSAGGLFHLRRLSRLKVLHQLFLGLLVPRHSFCVQLLSLLFVTSHSVILTAHKKKPATVGHQASQP